MISRERLEDGRFRIVFRGDFRDDSLADVVSDWIETKSDFESAAQSTALNPAQPFTTMSRSSLPCSVSNRMRPSRELNSIKTTCVPSGESIQLYIPPEFMSGVSRVAPFPFHRIESLDDDFLQIGARLPNNTKPGRQVRAGDITKIGAYLRKFLRRASTDPEISGLATNITEAPSGLTGGSQCHRVPR